MKRSSISLLSLIGFSLLFFASCKKSETESDHAIEKLSKRTGVQKNISVSDEYLLMDEFAKLLSDVVRNEEEVRLFLKNEANKQIDLDYDVLYQLVKDQKISKNESLHDKLSKYARSEERLIEIESQLPLLTIFIPELPSGFSARTWKAESDIPAVTTGFARDKKVSFIMSDGKTITADYEAIPGFPVLIIKRNDRIIVSENSEMAYRPSSTSNLLASDMFSYEFLSENFNGIQTTNVTNTTHPGYHCAGCVPDSKVLTAYELATYDYPGADLWQRDYIYYSVHPGSVNGPLDLAYQEHLTSIQFQDGLASYRKITDQGDPMALTGFATGWTEGAYEFNLTTLLNSQIGLGATITKLFHLTPSQLFDVSYRMETQSGFPVYYTTGVTSKRALLNLRISPWDIRTTSVAWKFVFSEVDPSQTVTSQYVVTSSIATNFGLDASNVFAKLGLKFGITSTQQTSHTHTVVSQLDDDNLGEADLYFYSKVIMSDDIIPNIGPSYNFYDADTGSAWLTIEPRRVF